MRYLPGIILSCVAAILAFVSYPVYKDFFGAEAYATEPPIKPMIQARGDADAMTWLESMGDLRCKEAMFDEGYRCRVDIGDWQDVMLSVSATAETTKLAADACAQRLREVFIVVSPKTVEVP